MKTFLRSSLTVAFGLALLGASASAQTLFSENFDVDHTANWVVNTLGPGNDANLFFDYSTIGIPSAPNSGGTTMGLRLRAHMLGSTAVFPAGELKIPISCGKGRYRERRHSYSTRCPVEPAWPA